VVLPPHVLEFASDDADATAALRALYHAAPTSDAPPTLRYRISRGGPDDYVATAPNRPPFGPASLGDCWAYLEWRAIEDVLNDPGPDSVYVHAAGISLNHKLFLLVGPSGSGKSTLTAILLARGCAALGDDVLRFAPVQGLFHPVPRAVKLDAKTLGLLPLATQKNLTDSVGTLLAAESWYVSPVAFGPAWLAGPGRPWAVVALEDAPHCGAARLERSGEGQVAVRVVQSLLGAEHGLSPERRSAAGLALLEAVADSRAYRACGEGAAALADLMQEEAARA